MDGPNNGIIFYHFIGSPYARRVLWYLALRGIDFAECLHSPMLPRPSVRALGIKYRRTPVMAIGRDVYCDSRLMLRKLEELFPDGTLGVSQTDQKAVEKLLEIWACEAGLLGRATQLIPTNAPFFDDKPFLKDREELSGRPWNREHQERNRPEAIAYFRNAFRFLETTLLADGRDWILKTDNPSLADIEGVFVFHWLNDMKGALPAELISDKQYPKVFAWINRFNNAVKSGRSKIPRPTRIDGETAAQRVFNAKYADSDIGIDTKDPLGLNKGDLVQVWPTDSGFNHRDEGRLIGLSQDEIVISIQTEDTIAPIHLHCPRTGFRVVAVKTDGQSKL